MKLREGDPQSPRPSNGVGLPIGSRSACLRRRARLRTAALCLSALATVAAIPQAAIAAVLLTDMSNGVGYINGQESPAAYISAPSLEGGLMVYASMPAGANVFGSMSPGYVSIDVRSESGGSAVSIANTVATPVPGAVDGAYFIGFTGIPAIDYKAEAGTGSVAFIGSWATPQGATGSGIFVATILHSSDGPISVSKIAKVVDGNTPIPNGTGTFGALSAINQPSIDGGKLVFEAGGNQASGLYEYDTASGKLGVVADTTTKIPPKYGSVPGGGNFAYFSPDPTISDGIVAFKGAGNTPVGNILSYQGGVFLADATTGFVVSVEDRASDYLLQAYNLLPLKFYDPAGSFDNGCAAVIRNGTVAYVGNSGYLSVHGASGEVERGGGTAVGCSTNIALGAGVIGWYDRSAGRVDMISVDLGDSVSVALANGESVSVSANGFVQQDLFCVTAGPLKANNAIVSNPLADPFISPQAIDSTTRQYGVSGLLVPVTSEGETCDTAFLNSADSPGLSSWHAAILVETVPEVPEPGMVSLLAWIFGMFAAARIAARPR